MTSPAYEVYFETLPGMTHCYEDEIANPKEAALQLLNKMKFLDSLGIKQVVLPPQEHPYMPLLKRIGFEGTTKDKLTSLKKAAPWLIPQICMSSNHRNATVCPSIDSANSHLHFTPANQASSFMRSQDTEPTNRLLKALFKNPVFFEIHPPLPAVEFFYDEGAKNHFRFCKNYGSPGVQLFTFGKSYQPSLTPLPFPEKIAARQSKEASEAITRLHRTYPGHNVFAFQNPNAIDLGTSHSDLLAISNQNLLLIHSRALWKQSDIIKQLKKLVADVSGTELTVIEITEKQLALKAALESHFFNSQIITLSDNSMTLISSNTCKEFESGFLKEILEDNDNPIGSIHFVDLSEINKKGGGPASTCLQVVMNASELSEISESVFFRESLYHQLVDHVNKSYPTSLSITDLSDPNLYLKFMDSLNEICHILNLKGIYSFQH